MTRKEIWQRVGIIALTAFIAFMMVWVTTYRRSVKYYNEGMKHYKNNELLDAVTSFEISAHAYTPFNRYVADSMRMLWKIGQQFEKEKKDPDYALIAYRSLRSSVYAIRSLYMPYKEWIPKCDERIRKLVALQKKELEKQNNP